MKSNELGFNIPNKCPKCGSELEEREGKYGKFLGCSKFPECRYTYDLSGDTTEVKCPECGKNLRFRSSKYGRFLSCSGFPDCNFAFNPNFKDYPDIYCPKCNKPLELEIIEEKKYLVCKGKPQCEFKIDWLDLQESLLKQFNYPKCPDCGNDLVKRSGKYGYFLSCISYSNCRFAFNPELENQRVLKCPECNKVLDIKLGKDGKFVGCSGYPECRYIFDLRN